MRVRLTKKLAERIDGVDLSRHKIGDCLDLPEPEGQLLIAEQWAFLERRAVDRGEHLPHSMTRLSHQHPPRATRGSAPACAARAKPSDDATSVAADRPPKDRSDPGD
jgi:hypothetical protein